jgi:D-glycero-D-manno-heptose 1,7-bisphosphate phosphatase
MKLIILDRDGTLNRSRDDYVASPDEWEALPGALEAVARLNQGGWRVVLATNQSGLGRGMFDMAALNAIHARMHKQLAAAGARVEAVFFCPHAPEDACSCRKPQPGLFWQIGERLGVDLAQVHAVGNALRHVQAAATAGGVPHLLLCGKSAEWRERLGDGPYGPHHQSQIPDLPAGTRLHTDLSGFADWLLAEQPPSLAQPSGLAPL